jgi:hypothetical protein
MSKPLIARYVVSSPKVSYILIPVAFLLWSCAQSATVCYSIAPPMIDAGMAVVSRCLCLKRRYAKTRHQVLHRRTTLVLLGANGAAFCICQTYLRRKPLLTTPFLEDGPWLTNQSVSSNLIHW